jgi:ferredoxin-NADP reductase
MGLANNLAGDFVLPTDHRTKLVFIAGGIGITPFRSMLKYLVDNRLNRTITLFYCLSDPKQIVYKDILNEAKEYGLKVVYVLAPPPGQEVPKSWSGEVGFMTKDLITKHVLDYSKRNFYVSGPDAMVQANKKLLRSMDIPRDQIKTDYFAGY